MGRYSDVNILRNRKPNQTPGPRYYYTVLYDACWRYGHVLYVYAEQGDRYDQLALQYYDDSSLWWVISIANSSLSQNSYFPPLGVQIRIPQNVGAIQISFEK